MERRIILNFIAHNYNSLKNIDFERINIYLYGKNYQKDSLPSLLLNGEKLFVYDIKLPRIYCKMLPMEKMYCGILDFAMPLKDLSIFSREDFTFDLEDVYSGKDIKAIDFKYLYLQPIIKDHLKQGIIVIYANQLIEDFKLIPLSITVLFNDLQNLEINTFEQNVINAIVDYDKYYYLLKENANDKVIISDSLRDKWTTTNQLTIHNELVINFMNHHLVKDKKLKFPFEKYKIFYVEKSVFDDITSKYLHQSALNNIELSNVFTLVVVDWSQNDEDFAMIVDRFNLNSKYYISAYDKDYYLLLIDTKVNVSTVKKMLKEYECFYTILNAPKDINRRMDFIKIANYIKDVKPNGFSYSDYLKYINDVNQDLLTLNLNQDRTQVIINSKTNTKIGILLNYVTDDFKYSDNANEYERRIINKLNYYNKINNEAVFCCLYSFSLIKRKIIEIYKKFLGKNLQLSIVVHYDQKQTKKDFYEGISIAKEYNIELYADSSIFLNLEFIDIMRYFDGCYVRKKEFESIQSAPNKFVNVFVSYYFNDNKKIIFEDTANKQFNQRYEDELIYFVKESEGKLNGKFK